MPADLNVPLRPHSFPGRLIVLEGCDGSGKTTLTRSAVEMARGRGRTCIEVQMLEEYVRVAPALRRYAHDPLRAPASVDLLGLSVLCTGSRIQTLTSTVLPALREGTWVFCDRYIYTTWAEFVALRSERDERETLRDLLATFPRPDLGFIVTATAQRCMERVRTRPDEATKVFDADWYRQIVATYREVGRANGMREVSTDRSSVEACEKLIDEGLELLHAGARDAEPLAAEPVRSHP